MASRTLLFPTEPVGAVEEIRSGRKQPAAGKVEVNADEPIRLTLERRHAEVLDSLGPDEIQGLFLWAHDRAVTRQTVQALQHLTGLIELHAPSKGPWDEAACAIISTLTKLRGLGILHAQKITDDGFGSLGRLTGLMKLRIEQARITDSALDTLDTMPALEALGLRSCRQLTDEALRAVARCPRLSELTLTGVQIGDDALVHLQGCTELRSLFLGSTQVTVDGLRHLPANDPPIRIVTLGSTGQLLSPADWKKTETRYPHLDFGGTRELTPNPTIRDKIIERGEPLAGWNASADAPVLAFFTTDGCRPCEQALPAVQRLARHWHDKLKTVRIHSPLHPDLVTELNVQSAPTMVLFLGKGRTVLLPGVTHDYDQLRAQLSPYLGFAVR